MKVLVTGASGFVGGVVAAAFARAGHQTLGLDVRPAAGVPWQSAAVDVFSPLLGQHLAQFNPEVVFHGVGSANVGRSFVDPTADRHLNVDSFAALLDTIRAAGVRPRVFLPSSAAVYGNPATIPTPEECPLAPISPYGVHKRMCEDLATGYGTVLGLEVTVLRVFSLVGPTQRRLLVWELFEQLAAGAAELTLQGSAEASRDYLGAQDFGAAVVALAGVPAPPPILNVASGRGLKVATVAQHIKTRVGSNAPTRFSGAVRPGDPLQWCADVSRLRSVLGTWEPQPARDAIFQSVDVWRGVEEPRRSGTP